MRVNDQSTFMERVWIIHFDAINRLIGNERQPINQNEIDHSLEKLNYPYMQWNKDCQFRSHDLECKYWKE